jgi:hypothetical protein
MPTPLRAILLLLFAITAWCADSKPVVLNTTTGNFRNLPAGDNIALPTAAGGWLVTIAPGVQAANRTLTFPVVAGADTFSVLGTAQTYSALKTYTGGVTLTTTALTLTDVNAALSTTTGTKWGTATNQKQAWYNATPVVQQTGDVATALVTYGLITSPTIVATTAIDGTFRVVGSGDATKKIGFEVDAQTTGKTLIIDTGAQTLDRTLSVPVLGGNDIIAVLGTAQTFTAAQTVSTTAAQLSLNATSGAVNLNLNLASAQKMTIACLSGTIPYGLYDQVNAWYPQQYNAGAVGAGYVTFNGTLAASSATAGAVLIGNGTAATNVAIGGGNINAGGAITASASSGNGTLAITSTNPATSTTTGSVINQGGYSATRASFLRGAAASGDSNALSCTFFANQSADPAGFRYALDFTTSCSGASAGNTGSTVGIKSDFTNQTAGITHTNAMAFYGILNTSNATAAITNGFGFYFANGTTTGTSTNKHAFYAEAVTGAANNYAFKSAGAGLISIGDTTNATTTTNGSIATAGGISAVKDIFSGGIITSTMAAANTLSVTSSGNGSTVALTAGAANQCKLTFTFGATAYTQFGGDATTSFFIYDSKNAYQCFDYVQAAASAAYFTSRTTTEATAVGSGSSGFAILSGFGVSKRSFLGTIGSTFKGNVLAGVQDATAASAGQVGEVLSSTVSTAANYTTTATYQAITSLSLTAGDWEITGFITFLDNGATLTATANVIGVIGTTTASAAGTTEGSGDIAYLSEVVNGVSGKTSMMLHKVVNISATTTHYLNSQATFTVGNPQFVGSLYARRLR